jgi:hypothetical protein
MARLTEPSILDQAWEIGDGLAVIAGRYHRLVTTSGRNAGPPRGSVTAPTLRQ